MVTEPAMQEKIRMGWARWRRSKSYYADELKWWERCVKPQLKRLLRQEEEERRALHRNMENPSYECLYDILKSTAPATEKLPALQRYKTKLVRLYAQQRNRLLLDTQEHDILEGEEPSFFQVLRIMRRCEVREIRQVTDIHDNTHTSLSEITAAFVSHMSHKYQPIAVDETIIANLQTFLHPVCPATYAEQLEQPINYDELLTAFRAGDVNRRESTACLSLEFYTANWETVREELLQLLNHIFLNKHTSEAETRDPRLSTQVY
jgi:hypothetical protein